MSDRYEIMKNLIYDGIVKRFSAPIEIYLELSNQCNGSCIYCYKKDFINKGTMFMPLKLVDNILKEIKSIQSNCLFVLEGGEPLLNPKITSIIKKIKIHGHTIDLITNGLNITEQFLNEISEFWDNENDEFQISLDDWDNNEIIRGYKASDIINKILILNEYGIQPRINMVVSKYNVHNVPHSISNIVRQVNIKNITVSKVLGNKKHQASKELLLTLKSSLEDHEFEYIFDNYSHKSFEEFIFCGDLKQNKFFRKCTALTSKICISTNGDYYPCVFYENKIPPLGNAYCHSISEVWDSSNSKKFIEWSNKLNECCISCSNNKDCTQICGAFI